MSSGGSVRKQSEAEAVSVGLRQAGCTLSVLPVGGLVVWCICTLMKVLS